MGQDRDRNAIDSPAAETFAGPNFALFTRMKSSDNCSEPVLDSFHSYIIAMYLEQLASLDSGIEHIHTARKRCLRMRS